MPTVANGLLIAEPAGTKWGQAGVVPSDKFCHLRDSGEMRERRPEPSVKKNKKIRLGTEQKKPTL
jgi:hypothetical protein